MLFESSSGVFGGKVACSRILLYASASEHVQYLSCQFLWNKKEVEICESWNDVIISAWIIALSKNLEVRSENGCETFLVWNRVRIWRTGRHTPTNNSQEYPPRYLGCENKTGTERLGKVSITRGKGLFLFYGGGCENRGKRSGVREFWCEHIHFLKKGIKDRPTQPSNQWFWCMLVLHSSKPPFFFSSNKQVFWDLCLGKKCGNYHTRTFLSLRDVL